MAAFDPLQTMATTATLLNCRSPRTDRPMILTRFVTAVAAALTTAAAPPPPVHGDTLPPLHVGSADMVCPVGGQRFTAVTTNMWSITGRRPDERPYSDVSYPRPLPECPDNGLVLFANFTAAETVALAHWIANPTYQSMRKTESSFYRAYWLAMKLHRPEADAIEQLLPAIWEAKELDANDPARPRTTRYQRVLINAVEKYSPAVSLDDRIWLRGQAANALREMGKFDAAERMRLRGEVELPNSTRPALSAYLRKLKAVIARQDRSDEPLDMVPDVQAALICANSQKRNSFDQSYCGQASITSIVKPVDVNSPSAVARRDDVWRTIEAHAQSCHVRILDKKLVSQNSVGLHMAYRLEPNTPENQHCMIKQSQHNANVKP